MIIGVKGQAHRKWKKMLQIKYLIKNLSGTSKEVLQLNNEITTQFLNGKNSNRYLSRGTYKSLVGIWKDVQHHILSSNYYLSKP